MTKLNCSELKADPPLMSYDVKAYPDPGSSRNVTNGVSFTVLQKCEINNLNTYALPHFLFVLSALFSSFIDNAECLCDVNIKWSCVLILLYCVPILKCFFNFQGQAHNPWRPVVDENSGELLCARTRTQTPCGISIYARRLSRQLTISNFIFMQFLFFSSPC